MNHIDTGTDLFPPPDVVASPLTDNSNTSNDNSNFKAQEVKFNRKNDGNNNDEDIGDGEGNGNNDGEGEGEEGDEEGDGESSDYDYEEDDDDYDEFGYLDQVEEDSDGEHSQVHHNNNNNNHSNNYGASSSTKKLTSNSVRSMVHLAGSTYAMNVQKNGGKGGVSTSPDTDIHGSKRTLIGRRLNKSGVGFDLIGKGDDEHTHTHGQANRRGSLKSSGTKERRNSIDKKLSHRRMMRKSRLAMRESMMALLQSEGEGEGEGEGRGQGQDPVPLTSTPPPKISIPYLTPSQLSYSVLRDQSQGQGLYVGQGQGLGVGVSQGVYGDVGGGGGGLGVYGESSVDAPTDAAVIFPLTNTNNNNNNSNTTAYNNNGSQSQILSQYQGQGQGQYEGQSPGQITIKKADIVPIAQVPLTGIKGRIARALLRNTPAGYALVSHLKTQVHTQGQTQGQGQQVNVLPLSTYGTPTKLKILNSNTDEFKERYRNAKIFMETDPLYGGDNNNNNNDNILISKNNSSKENREKESSEMVILPEIHDKGSGRVSIHFSCYSTI